MLLPSPKNRAVMLALYTLILAFSAFLFAAITTWGLVKLLPTLALIDEPNERSNHVLPTPRGGGIAVTGSALFFLIAASAEHHVVLGLLVAAIISFMDDRRSQPVLRRLLAHFLAAGLVVMAITHPVFQGLLPPLADRVVSVLLLVYFMNLFNFMDGIDEISVAETVTLGIGLVALVWVDLGHQLSGSLAIDGMILVGSVLGFWLFNRHPARIFLGDTGSIPLGLMAGYLLLRMASEGDWIAALILPAYYLVDASSTLFSRLLRGKRLWEAHSEHAYQRAVRSGLAHNEVSRVVMALGVILIVLAAMSTLPGHHLPFLALGAAYLLSFATVGFLHLRGARPLPAHG